MDGHKTGRVLFKPGVSGNPAGKPKGSVSGRQRALSEVDRLLSEDESIECLGNALREALHKKPLWFFINIIMPLLPKEMKGSLESDDRVIEWRGLVTVGAGTPGVTRKPDAAGGFGVVEDRGCGTALPPVNTVRSLGR